MNGGIPKEFYKGVSCVIKDFAVRGSKLIASMAYTLEIDEDNVLRTI